MLNRHHSVESKKKNKCNKKMIRKKKRTMIKKNKKTVKILRMKEKMKKNKNNKS